MLPLPPHLRWLNVDEDDLAEEEGALTTVTTRGGCEK